MQYLGSLLSLLCLAAWTVGAEPAFTSVTVDPVQVRLTGPLASWSLLVSGKRADSTVLDLTHDARYRSENPRIASVSETGVVRGVGDGSATVTVEAGGKTRTVVVKVEGSQSPRTFNFENDIIPLLSKYGCNSSGCHGKAEGQNGFKLSVFGFDPAGDFSAIVKEGRGRRVFPASPEASLLLAKMSGGVAHGGGVRVTRGSSEYETVRAWIAAGTPFGNATDPKVVSVRVEPSERVLDMHGQQQLRVIAKWSNGHEADVTPHAKYQSNNDGIAVVNGGGLVTAGEVPGDVAVMVSYMNEVDTFRALVPRAERIASYPKLPENNFIDGHVYRKLQKLNIVPSEVASDADFLRRVYLDVIGTLPTAEEARKFLADPRTDKRARIVDELLERPEFADYWALKWSDLLRVERGVLGHKRAYGFYKWIRESIRENKPLDQFAQEVLTAEGPVSESAPASFFKVVTKPGETASTLSQVFLGVRIACAECHHHPFDRWSQSDYQGMQAFFMQVGFKPTSRGEALVTSGDPVAKHPRTGETIHAYALGTAMPKASPSGDRRVALAAWMTSGENPYFARNLANRIWAHFLGRGLVEPVDDVRATNPPSNPELLDALTRHLVEKKFDFKAFVRTVTASRIYQLSSRPNETNERDEQNYSRALFKRIDAEVLLDMVSQTTGVPEKFPGTPAGTRAVQLWDSKTTHYFLKLFGRPVRASACECERVTEPTVAQVLHLLNATEIHAKLSHEGGAIARLVGEITDDAKLVEELYLTFYARPPSDKERAVAVKYLQAEPAKRRQAAEDLAWTLMNSLEFVFNH